MKHIKLLGAALVAVFAMSAAATTTAAADQPEFVNSSNEEVKGRLFSNSAASATLDLPEGVTIACSGSSGMGEITSTTEVGHMRMTYTGCENTLSKTKCKSPGGGNG